ncbi:hypothetical protein POUND7_019126 [Theobroma cacao]
MEILGNGKNESDCDRMKELKAFDDTKLGVQGLVDSGFHEQDLDERKEFYSRGRARRVRFNSNHDLFQSNRADRRDTLSVSMLTSDHVDPNELPTSCRVLPRRVPRISVICFFTGRADPPARLDGPIKELISEGNPSKYRELLVSEYVSRFFTRGLHEKPSLKDYRL